MGMTLSALAYAGFHANGVLRGVEWWNLMKNSQKQADLNVFASDPQGTRAPLIYTPLDTPVVWSAFKWMSLCW